MNTLSYFMPALPEVILVFAILGMTLFGAFSKQKEKTWFFRLILCVLFAVAVSLFFVPSMREITFNGHFFNDSFSLFVKCIIVVVAFFVQLNLQSHLSFFKVKHYEFGVLLLCTVLGMFILISANDFLPMYMGLEIQSLSLYVMIGLFHEEKNVSEAVIKYFMLGAVASAFILFGISFIYGYAGTANFFMLEDILESSTALNLGLSIGIAFLICGFAFKVSAVPFHMWTPDVYQGTPYPLLVLLSTAPKIAALGFIMRLLCGPLYNTLTAWQPIVLTLSIVSMIFGAVAAVMQSDMRRFLAYASISSIGFSLTGVCMANQMGLKASLFYTVLYIIAMIGFLTCVMILLRNGSAIQTLADVKGLAIERPFIAIALGILLLTMSGLPPFPGFLGKLFLLQAVIGSEYYILALVMVLTTVVGAYYYLNIIKMMFFDAAQNTSVITSFSASMGMNYLVVVISISILALLVFMPKFLLNWAGLAAATLFYG
ncbi:MAG: NADH-quinone oxidoreductase subunit N [Alphaproteobacteria bacterium]|nr:NADH-quinone oxidoreductase subunit N [Alphaproteobacteria bacterium]